MVAIPGAIGHIKSGTLDALAVTSRERVKALPTVPTIGEAGVPDYQINAFHGIFSPAGTPREVVARLEKDITAVLESPEVNRKLIDLGFDPVAGSGADLAAIIDRDLPVWRDVVAQGRERGPSERKFLRGAVAMKRVLAGFFLLCMATAIGPAHACPQSSVLKLVVPFPPGRQLRHAGAHHRANPGRALKVQKVVVGKTAAAATARSGPPSSPRRRPTDARSCSGATAS